VPDKILECRAAVRLPPDVLQQVVRFHWLHYIVCTTNPRGFARPARAYAGSGVPGGASPRSGDYTAGTLRVTVRLFSPPRAAAAKAALPFGATSRVRMRYYMRAE
jgi:hypothetical protein